MEQCLAAPIGASLFADPRLLELRRAALRTLGTGPQVPLADLAGYLDAERAAGRIAPGTDPTAAAALLLGACFQRAFLAAFLAESPPPDGDDNVATALAHALITGLANP